MSKAGINIRTIAQGSSERQISLVVARDDVTRALRAAHAALALSNSQLSVVVIGARGRVGSRLLRQMRATKRIAGGAGRVKEAALPVGGESAEDARAVSQATARAESQRQVLDDLRIEFRVTGTVDRSSMRLSYDGVPTADTPSTPLDLFSTCN